MTFSAVDLASIPAGTALRCNRLIRAAVGQCWSGDTDAARRLLGAAAALDPTNVDIVVSIAHTHILDDNLPDAVRMFDAALTLNPVNDDVRVLRAVYVGLMGGDGAARRSWEHLQARRPEFAARWMNVVTIAEQASRTHLTADIPNVTEPDQHAYILLGYALHPDGSASGQLTRRLRTAMRCLTADATSRIILSGGHDRAGSSEAAVMHDYLTSHGIPNRRLLVEDSSLDTLENVLFSLALASDQRITHLTVITSDDHMRRALALFGVGNLVRSQTGTTPIPVLQHVTDQRSATTTVINNSQRISVYRDALRLAGLWAFPGVQR